MTTAALRADPRGVGKEWREGFAEMVQTIDDYRESAARLDAEGTAESRERARCLRRKAANLEVWCWEFLEYFTRATGAPRYRRIPCARPGRRWRRNF
jgi:hypothetical protein